MTLSCIVNRRVLHVTHSNVVKYRLRPSLLEMQIKIRVTDLLKSTPFRERVNFRGLPLATTERGGWVQKVARHRAA